MGSLGAAVEAVDVGAAEGVVVVAANATAAPLGSPLASAPLPSTTRRRTMTRRRCGRRKRRRTGWRRRPSSTPRPPMPS